LYWLDRASACKSGDAGAGFKKVLNTGDRVGAKVTFKDAEEVCGPESIRVSAAAEEPQDVTDAWTESAVSAGESGLPNSPAVVGAAPRVGQDDSRESGATEAELTGTLAEAGCGLFWIRKGVAQMLVLISTLLLICLAAPAIEDLRSTANLKITVISLEAELWLGGVFSGQDSETRSLYCQRSLAGYYFLLDDFEQSLKYDRNVVALLEQRRRQGKGRQATSGEITALERAHLNSGECLFKLGRYREALTEFELATRNARWLKMHPVVVMMRFCRAVENQANSGR
jgi:hypothetical protein